MSFRRFSYLDVAFIPQRIGRECLSPVQVSLSLSRTGGSMNSKTALRRLILALDEKPLSQEVAFAVSDAKNVLGIPEPVKTIPAPTERAVIVCTDKRGVFFGYATSTDGDPIRLARARMAVYWSSDVKSVLGLACTGPTKSCRIGQAAPMIELRGITSVFDVSDAARLAWESAPWSA